MITVEKIYSIVEPGVVPPLEAILKAMHETSPTDCTNFRFKKRTWHDKTD